MSIPSGQVLSQIVLLTLFLLTAAAVTGRPFRISEGWWPVGAVAAALLPGAVPATTAGPGGRQQARPAGVLRGAAPAGLGTPRHRVARPGARSAGGLGPWGTEAAPGCRGHRPRGGDG